MEVQTIEMLHFAKAGKVSDKWASYLTHYDKLFAPLRNSPISMLEIGVQNGGSLETWSSYFTKAQRIIGSDIDPKCEVLHYDDPRINVVVGDINAATTLKKILDLCPQFDVIIDDGSHISIDIINSFINYFPHVKSGGIYVVEDTHCLYMNSFGGGILNDVGAYAFFKKLVDVIGFQFWRDDLSIQNHLRTFFDTGVTPSFILEGWVESIEFRNSLITVHKAARPGHDKLGRRITTGSVAQVKG